ncbi:hypothetical protein [Roseixanthobacter glucoisosaccharinicivorans]|uniref:hypothetical protein n=1 Tax=Roseixanthobacter glucoisosaccharinicivorans TaxID=3119923 RepID=UPI00372B6200
MRLKRADVKAARMRARGGDVGAARLLLAHSVACGHERLALRRYFFARMLGASDLAEFEPFCGQVAARLAQDELKAMARDAVVLADRLQNGLHGSAA